LDVNSLLGFSVIRAVDGLSFLFMVDKSSHLTILYIFIAGQENLLKIRVADITEKEKTLAGVEDINLYPTLMQAQEAGECKFLSPVDISLTVKKEFDHIRVHGSVDTSVSLVCSRCLCEFSTELSSAFTIFYTKSSIAQSEDEVELGEQDLISATYAGDEIDFSDEVAEQILLELPYKPLCSQECKGLCTSCGVDLNSKDCSCNRNAVSIAFSSLKGLKVTH